MSLPAYITTIIGPPARLAIVRLLSVKPMTIREMCDHLEVTHATVRRPLMDLVASGLVLRRVSENRRSAVYRLDPVNMRKVRECVAVMFGGAA